MCLPENRLRGHREDSGIEMSGSITLTISIKIDVHAWLSQSSFSDDLPVRARAPSGGKSEQPQST